MALHTTSGPVRRCTQQSVKLIVMICAVRLSLRDVTGDERALASYLPRDIDIVLDARDLSEPLSAEDGASHPSVASVSSQDLIDLLCDDLEADAAREARATLERIVETARSVDWRALVEHEFLAVARLGFPPEMLALFRATADTIEVRYAELERALAELRDLAPEVLRLTRSTEGGVRATRLTLAALPVGISLAASSDVVCVSTSAPLFQEFLKRASDPAEESLARSDGILRALRQVGRREFTNFLHVDGESFCEFFAEVATLTEIREQSGATAKIDAKLARVAADVLSQIESAVLSWEERPNGGVVEAVIGFRGKKGTIESFLARSAPPTRLLRFIPQESSWFVVAGGLPWSRLWNTHGESAGGLDAGSEDGLRGRDYLPALEGGGALLSVPFRNGVEGVFAVLAPRRPGDTLLRHQVLRALARHLEGHGQRLVIEPSPRGGERLYRARLAAFPTWSCVGDMMDGFFVVASSPEAVFRVYETYLGALPDARTPDDSAAGGVPEGLLLEAHCRDVRRTLLAAADRLAPLLVGGAFLPGRRESTPLMRFAPLLSRAVEALRRGDTSRSLHLRLWHDRAGRKLRVRATWRLKAAVGG